MDFSRWAMGLVQSSYPIDGLTFVYVDDINRIIAKFRHEQAVLLRVNSKIIDAAGNTGQRYCRLEFKWRRPCGSRRA